MDESKREIKKRPGPRIFHAIKGQIGDYQADIMFMKYHTVKEYVARNGGYKSLLVIVEVPTRFAYVVPLKTKSMGEVLRAFIRIYDDTKQSNVMNSITTDAGSEFQNNIFKDFCYENYITHFVKEPEDYYSLGIVDRLIRTLKTWVYDWQTENNSKSWVGSLPEIIRRYNEHQVRTLRASPDELREDEQKFEEAQSITEDRAIIGLKNLEQFHIGDHVRIRLRPEDQPGELGKTARHHVKGVERWSNAVFVIQNINKLSFELVTLSDYLRSKVLMDYQAEPLPRTYRAHELQKVSKSSVDVPDPFSGLSEKARAKRRLARL